LAGLTTVAIGDREIAVRSIAPEGAPFPIAVPEDPEPGEESMRAAWDLFRQIADASSWAALALNVDRRQAGVRAAFYGDHRADIPIELERAAGGVRLLQWVHATDDANRLEAFRHVLRMASLGSPGMLPSADNVRTLAERERIALSRENAAEVQRAISGGHREASDSLVEASTHMADLVHSAAKAVNATLIAAVGVFALSGDSGALLGPEVLWPVAAALVLVAGLSSRASDRRLMDQKAEVEARRDRLSEDPLLPEADHERIAARFAGFGLDARLKGARRTLWAFFLVSAVVILVGAAIVAEQPRETASGNSGSAQQETPVPVPKKSLRPSLAPTPQPAVSSAP
jgi:hypothetical protein